MSAQRAARIVDSFNYALEGIIHVLRTQRNMRIHFALAVFVLTVAVVVDVTKLELIALLISITFVLWSPRSFNTAIESAIDVATSSFDPLAKLTKDIAAGAVLIAAINAWCGRLPRLLGQDRRLHRAADRPRAPSPRRADDRGARGDRDHRDQPEGVHGQRHASRRPPSGHAAVAFAGGSSSPTAQAPTHRFLVSTVAFGLALLVAQTRVESGVHSSLEVLLGALLGSLTALALFQFSA
jgi:diacylglycerol kinase (ATP)